MKRIIAIVLAALLSFTLVACKEDSSVKVLSPEETEDRFAFLDKDKAEEDNAAEDTEDIFTEKGNETEKESPQSEKTENHDLSGTVYITDSGEKYHSEGCRHLNKSKIPISRSDAIAAGYEPCKVCKPG